MNLLHPQIAEDALVGGKYRLKRKLAEGGGGAVWLAADGDGNQIALKFLKWSPRKSPEEAARRFKNEFAILKNISHPNIGAIYDFGRDAATGLYFFTSELFKAGDLRKLSKAPIETIEELLLQALRALEYLRNQGLIHLDIKPQNILLRKKGRRPQIALIDFGLATFRPHDRPGGTPHYMPPEIVIRRLPDPQLTKMWPEPDHRSDLYSLGVTFYMLLTGIHPFKRTFKGSERIDPLATMQAHLETTPAPPSAHRPEIPPYLDHIIMKLMSRNPEDRYTTAGVAAQALQFRSPRAISRETRASLLAYLPKEGRLIGRRSALETIEATCSGIAAGTPHIPALLLIAGGKGIGKSRLLGSIKPLAQRHEMTVITIDCLDAEGAPSLDDILEYDAFSQTKALVILIDNIHALFTSADLSPRAEHLLEGIRHVVRRLRLHQRVTDATAKRYLLACSCDDDELAPSRLRLELELDDQSSHLLQLHAFTTAEISEYLTSLLGEKADPGMVKSLEEATNGNPLFITELLERMIGKGKLFTLAGRPSAQALKSIGVDFEHVAPSTSLKESILRELKALSPEARAVALELACFHRPAAVEDLSRCSSGILVPNALLELVEKGLVKRDLDTGCYAFVNSLAGRIIDNALPRQEHALWHDRIAALLKASGTASGEALDFHLSRGSDWAIRLEALWRLVDVAFDTNHAFDAVEHLRQILAELPATAWDIRTQAIIKLGQAYDRMRQLDTAIQTFKRLEQTGAPDPLRSLAFVQMHEQLGLLWLKRRNLHTAKESFAAAAALLPPQARSRIFELRLANYLAAIELREGNLEKARALYEKNAQAAMMLSGEERNQIINNDLGEATLLCGKARKAITLLKRELRSPAVAANAERKATRYYLLGEAHAHEKIRKHDEALKHYRKGLEIAKRHHHLELEVRLHNGIGNLFRKQEKLAEAAKNYRRALELAQQIESEMVSVELMVNLGIILSKLNQPVEAIEYLEASLDFAMGPKGEAGAFVRKKRAEILITLGDALYRQRDFVRAERYLVQALADGSSKELDPAMKYNLYGTLFEVYLAEGRKDEAHDLWPELKTLADALPQAHEHFESLSLSFTDQISEQ